MQKSDSKKQQKSDSKSKKEEKIEVKVDANKKDSKKETESKKDTDSKNDKKESEKLSEFSEFGLQQNQDEDYPETKSKMEILIQKLKSNCLNSPYFKINQQVFQATLVFIFMPLAFFVNSNVMMPNNQHNGVPQDSFVHVISKGTVAYWVFYLLTFTGLFLRTFLSQTKKQIQEKNDTEKKDQVLQYFPYSNVVMMCYPIQGLFLILGLIDVIQLSSFSGFNENWRTNYNRIVFPGNQSTGDDSEAFYQQMQTLKIMGGTEGIDIDLQQQQFHYMHQRHTCSKAWAIFWLSLRCIIQVQCQVQIGQQNLIVKVPEEEEDFVEEASSKGSDVSDNQVFDAQSVSDNEGANENQNENDNEEAEDNQDQDNQDQAEEEQQESSPLLQKKLQLDLENPSNNIDEDEASTHAEV